MMLLVWAKVFSQHICYLWLIEALNIANSLGKKSINLETQTISMLNVFDNHILELAGTSGQALSEAFAGLAEGTTKVGG